MNSKGVPRRATDMKFLVEFHQLYITVGNQHNNFRDLMMEISSKIDYVEVDTIKKVIAVLKQVSGLFSRSQSTLEEASHPYMPRATQ